MSAIVVRGLSKTFRTKVKEPGLKGSIRSLYSPSYKITKAVDNISFEIPKGQSVGFVGPNGAGKSTTIKILTGILFPTKGDCDVAGFVPWKQRKKLAYKIGTVFGQRSQLWLHLPCRDTFDLLAAIYDLPKKKARHRVKELAKEFEIEDLLDVPVRKLSLGQRMRAELVAALLHEPQILYLDEPTIGLDIIAKKKLREHIKRINKEEGVTVLFTSHDMDDIEDVCERVMVINHGKIVHDSTIEDMKKSYLQKKMAQVYLHKPGKKIRKKGISVLKESVFKVTLEINRKQLKIKDALKKITEHYDVEDIEISDPPIEEIIEDIYKKKK